MLDRNKTLYLLDGSGFIFRAYHSLPPLTGPGGTPLGAVYGFVNILNKLVSGMGAHYIAVVFDAARKTFRNDIYPEYKAHRPATPEDLIPQFAIVREATEALNLMQLEKPGFEADDIIATLTFRATQEGMNVVIVSSDKDLMQLVAPNISLLDPIKMKTLGEAEVMEKFGVPPKMVRDFLALTGDASDNVPGVPGIGSKTAAELLLKFGSLDELYNQLDTLPKNKRRETLEQNRELAFISQKLVTLESETPLELGIQDLEYIGVDNNKLSAFLLKYGFKSLLSRFKLESAVTESSAVNTSNQANDIKLETINSKAALESFCKMAAKEPSVAVCLSGGFEAEGITLSLSSGTVCHVPFAKQAAKLDLLDQNQTGEVRLTVVDAMQILKPLLVDDAVLKIGHDIKSALPFFIHHGIDLNPFDDVMLMSYSLDAGRNGHTMEELAKIHLGMEEGSFKPLSVKGKNKSAPVEANHDTAGLYSASIVYAVMRLHGIFKQRLFEEKAKGVYYNIERPLTCVLNHMEARGVLVDRVVLNRLSQEFATRMDALEKDIHKLAGRAFNVGSPKQLGEILFEEMGITGGKKSAKSGAYETSAEVLEELAAGGFEIANKTLEWRQLQKLKSTYTDALDKQINPKTGRVHTRYGMAVAATGRLSSIDPNLQNIPIRTQEGRKIRTAFIAASGYKLISADYSQIELRLLAEMADITPLKEAFKSGRDIHAATAADMFGVPLDKVDSELRRRAKTINFGIIYGISAYGLASRLGISNREAADFINAYFNQYPGIKDYMERTKLEAREKGFVSTMFGRKCHIPGINDKNGAVRSFSERAAINAPLQGTAADIIKIAMINIHLLSISAHMLLQVHDELLFEVKAEEAEAQARIIKKTMESAVHLSLPLTVEIGIGDNWGAIH